MFKSGSDAGMKNLKDSTLKATSHKAQSDPSKLLLSRDNIPKKCIQVLRLGYQLLTHGYILVLKTS